MSMTIHPVSAAEETADHSPTTVADADGMVTSADGALTASALTREEPSGADRAVGQAADEGAAPTPKPSSSGVRHVLKRIAVGFVALIGLVIALGAVAVAYSSRQTEADIEGLREQVAVIAAANPSPVYDPTTLGDLPDPVQRYFDYTFVDASSPIESVEITMAGDFRRPLTEGFSPTTAEQTIAVGIPSLAFSARTSMAPGLWARAYDFYADGQMEMKAKVMSTLTVVDESETPELNQTSLQRWLLESPMYPAALLPGGPVRWEAIDDLHARAIVAADGLEASLVATFRPDGSLESFAAETDGDLTTPYHGSGEYVARGDDRLVDGMMIPHSFSIARAAGGERYPFWTGEIETITFHTVDETS